MADKTERATATTTIEAAPEAVFAVLHALWIAAVSPATPTSGIS